MMVKTEKQIQLFKASVENCVGYVSLIDPRYEKEYDLRCSEELKEAIRQLTSDTAEQLELYTSHREDTQTMLALMYELKQEAAS